MIISEEEYFQHHGVKGMRWGVRKKEASAGGSGGSSKPESGDKVSPDLQKKLDSSKRRLTPIEKRNIEEAQKKHDAHFEKSVDENPKGWRPTGKQVALAAAGAIIVGGIAYKVYSGNKSSPISLEAYQNAVRSSNPHDWLKGYAGKSMSATDFKGISQDSIGRVWSGSYITKESFHGPITYNSGHQFFRVSHAVEESFGRATFATASKEDAARYFLGWKENTTNLITFKAKGDVKIPDLHTALETTRELLVSQGKKPTPAEVVAKLNNFAGSDFVGTKDGQAIVQRLIAKGYHGIVDYMDHGVYGETPMVLFDPSRFTDKVTTLRDNVDMTSMTSILTDLPNRR